MIDIDDFGFALMVMVVTAAATLMITLSIAMTPPKIVKQGWFECEGKVYIITPADVVAKKVDE